MNIEDDLQRYEKIEDFLDRGLGACELRDERAARIVADNWLHLDGEKYRPLAWVVMPNHVHLLVEIWQVPQSELVKNWKGYSARRVNELLEREGELWQEDYWDRYIRDEAHYRKVVHYIESNPVKAGLVKEACNGPSVARGFETNTTGSHDRSADRPVRVFVTTMSDDLNGRLMTKYSHNTRRSASITNP